MSKMVTLSGKAITLIVVFTIIETIILTAWLLLLDIPVNTGIMSGIGAAAVLFFGLLIEHIIAGISNKV